MPALLLFAPCEKAIVDRNGALSLVSVMAKLTVGVPGGAPPLPANALLPMQWAIVSIWQQASEWERGRAFEQRAALVSEAGTILLDSVTEFRFTTEPTHQVIVQIAGLPIGAVGANKTKVWIRDKSESPKEWKEAGSFPLTIEIAPVSPPAAAATTN